MQPSEPAFDTDWCREGHPYPGVVLIDRMLRCHPCADVIAEFDPRVAPVLAAL